ncbi:RNA N6-adenosine-methyltransferase mettl16-like isoform X2 [Ostrea edulis]|nr:RNA N6-adenosine-methyltransferase mettl16-like isoform X2 [Ostrea edulis]XP_048767719.2 RNA N6-adenosine-methyltransferase mettl16-like isoform X2 [Ostrea edulis]
MALNKFMHPRNPYKDKPPNFKNLSLRYPEFAKCIFQDLKGKFHLDYKSPTSLRQLAIALLKEDFDLDVEMPLNRLIPTIPLRLNYILWIEDILKEVSDVKLKGIDIGTGASCVYPLLGCKKNGWGFLASELDETNFSMAEKNVQKNNMQEKIKVKKVSGKTALLELMAGESDQYDFCMCNPPFFADHMEAQAITSSRTDDRAEPTSINTASVGESITEGGEVEFIHKIIVESIKLQGRIKFFTSMIGKKTNLLLVKKDLRDHKIPNYQTTEFCQGKTMRWGVAWTFDANVSFPRSLFQDNKRNKKLAVPLTYAVPQSAVSVYDVEQVTDRVLGLIKALQIEYIKSKDGKTNIHLKLTAYENTWSHLRRKRREMKRKGEEQNTDCISKKKRKIDRPQEISEDAGLKNQNNGSNLKRKSGSDNETEHANKIRKIGENLVFPEGDNKIRKIGKNLVFPEGDNKIRKIENLVFPEGENKSGDNEKAGGPGIMTIKSEDEGKVSAPGTSMSSDPSTPNVSSVPSTSSVSSDPSTPNVSSDPSTPNVSSDPSTANVSSDPSTANVSSDPSTANVSSDPSTANVSSDLSAPNVSSDLSAPNVSSDLRAPNVSSDAVGRDKDLFLIKCDLFIKVTSQAINIEMVYEDGQKDQMNQILQYIKNHLPK